MLQVDRPGSTVGGWRSGGQKTAKIGRNDPCPCGSGKKYKACCAGKTARRDTLLSKGMVAFLGALLVVGIVAIAALFYSSDRSTEATRVWPSEHGHWHEASGLRTP